MSQPGFQRRAGAAPPPAVLAAFGVDGPLRQQGVCWIADGVVLKPGSSDDFASWCAGLNSSISQRGFRLAAPIAASSGQWTHLGWSATRLMPGEPAHTFAPPPWDVVIAAGRAFHRAVADVLSFPARDDAWSRADEAAWGERSLPVDSPLASCVARLRGGLAELGAAQLVHGDLTGNVLVVADGDPVIIDLSPYHRPPAYAEGIVVADALCWHDAPGALLDELGVSVAAVARALLFRLLTTSQQPVVEPDEIGRYERAASAIGL